MRNTFLDQQDFKYDETSETYYKTIGKYDVLITSYMNNQNYINVSVSSNGIINQDELKQFVKNTKSIRQFNTQGNRLSFLVKSGLTKNKTNEYIADALNEVINFLTANGYKQCSEVSGNQDNLGIYCVGGMARIMNDQEYQDASEKMIYAKQELDNKKENVLAGAVGALLGSLVGVAAIVIIGQLGYISVISGIIMGICTIKGYELLSGKVSKTGVIISIIIMTLMCIVANRLDWAITITREIGWPIIDSFLHCGYVLDYYDLKGSYYLDLGMKLLFTLLAASPYVVGVFKTKQKQMDSHVIVAARKDEDNYDF